MDFEEFQWARGDKATLPLLEAAFKSKTSLGDETNRKLMRDFRLYMLVGGMPQAVDTLEEIAELRESKTVLVAQHATERHLPVPFVRQAADQPGNDLQKCRCPRACLPRSPAVLPHVAQRRRKLQLQDRLPGATRQEDMPG